MVTNQATLIKRRVFKQVFVFVLTTTKVTNYNLSLKIKTSEHIIALRMCKMSVVTLLIKMSLSEKLINLKLNIRSFYHVGLKKF